MIKSHWFRAVPLLVSVNIIFVLLEQLLPNAQRIALIRGYGLSKAGLMEGHLWQFITHAFLHGGTASLFINSFHLLVNVLGLWFAGRIVERVMGTGRFFALYLVSAIGGGLAHIIFSPGDPLLVGASGAVCGVILAFTTIFPEAKRTVLFFFVLPIPLKAKYLGWLVTGTSLFFLVTGFLPVIGHAAHLGGCVTGYLFTRLAGYGTPTFVEKWWSGPPVNTPSSPP